ncbi:MAG: alpha/beta hydrolase [Saprospiraceae bacterium]|nr:alpha/beta hydrolase [Saprospiraceae bacterium]
MPLRLRLLLFYLNYIAKQLDYSKLDAPTVRKINQREFEKVDRLIDYPAEPMAKVWDEEIPVREGSQIPVRIYQAVEEKHLPLIVFYHGGGFVTRSIATHDKACRRIAKQNRAVVVSVGYRLAPEFKFPIPVHDCYDACCWAAEQAGRLGADVEKLVVMGDSAGGNLAAVSAILARDNNGPKISAQVLIYPTVDGRLINPTIDQFAEGYLLTKPQMQWFVNHYRRSIEDVEDPLMSPILTANLAGLPPTYISTAEYDPLKGEGADYSTRLKEAGNSVFYKDYKGTIHAFLNLPKITVKASQEMMQDIRQFLQNTISNG